jgi:hypothetical protein
MRFSLHFRAGLKRQISELAGEMAAWETAPRIDESEAEKIKRSIRFFAHTTHRHDLVVGGVDGSGDYPALSYGDSFIYVTVAHGTRYTADPTHGLREQPAPESEIVEFSWIPEDPVKRHRAIDAAFERMAGQPIIDVIAGSDYRELKDAGAKRGGVVRISVCEAVG